MSDRQVRPVDDGWSVKEPDDDRPTDITATQAESVRRAVDAVAEEGGSVEVHGADGEVRETREVPAGTDDTDRIAAEIVATATATGAAENARATTDEVEQTAGAVAEDVTTTATKVRGHTRTGGKRVGATAAAAAEGIADQVGGAVEGDKSVEAAAKDAAAIADVTGRQAAAQAEGTAREVAGETRAAARRTAATLEQEADKAADQLASATDRAAKVGASIDQDLHGASDRTGRTIHAYTEAAAAPLDRLAATLNPIRITGRVVGLVAAGGLAVVGTLTGRATSTADAAARRLNS